MTRVERRHDLETRIENLRMAIQRRKEMGQCTDRTAIYEQNMVMFQAELEMILPKAKEKSAIARNRVSERKLSSKIVKRVLK